MPIATGKPEGLPEGRPDAQQAPRRLQRGAGVPTRAKQGDRGCRQTPPATIMLLRIKDVSMLLNIKPSTLYLWAAQGKIPSRKIHGLVRFEREAIIQWLQTFNGRPPNPIPCMTRSSSRDLDEVIAVAKRAAYTARHGETISPSPKGKEQNDGAR